MSSDFIEVFDGSGRRLHISRADWLRSILPDNLKAAWDEPDRLYGLLVDGLTQGLSRELLEAAQRLHELDAGAERGALVLAVTHLKCDQLDDAERILDRFVAVHGETGAALTNLAKVYAARGDADRALQTLERGLKLDPNLDHGLDYYLVLLKEQQGDAAMRTALQQLAESGGSWRAATKLIAEDIEAGRKAEGLARARRLSPTVAANGDALWSLSGIFGLAAMPEAITELIAPIYDAERHGATAGLNVGRALMETGRFAEARQVVRSLHRVATPDLYEHVDHLECEVAQRTPPRPVTKIEVSVVNVAAPLWLWGLENPHWLLPEVRNSAPTVGFLPFTDGTHPAGGAQAETEDDRGRFCRATPLALAEAMRFMLEAHTRFHLPVVLGGGPIFSGAPFDEQGLQWARQAQPASDLLVTGHIEKGLFGTALRVSVWDAKAGSKQGDCKVKLPKEDANALSPLRVKLLETLAKCGVARRTAAPQPLENPPAEIEPPYLLSLGQLLVQVLCGAGATSADGLWGERGMLSNYFRVAERLPATGTAFAACGVIAGLRYGSAVAEQFVARLLELLNHAAQAGNPSGWLAPVVLRETGRTAEIESWLAEHPARPADGRYQEWLARVRQ